MIDLGRIIRTGLALSAAWLTLQATAQNASDATLQLLTYKIKAGDTLHKIASAYLIDGVNIERVAQINQIKDLDLILAGAELQLPKAFVKFTPTSATVMSLSCAGAILLDHSVALKLGQKVIEGAVIDVPPECHISLVIEKWLG